MIRKLMVILGLFGLVTSLYTFSAFAEEKGKDSKEEPKPKLPPKEEVFAEKSMNKLAETYGHMVFKSLENPYLKLNFNSVMKGMQDAKAGKAVPMTDQEYEEAVHAVEEYAYEDMAQKNLKDAEKFLKDNAKKEGVKVLEADKLQLIVLKDGTGKVVTEEFQPVIKYSGKYADGTVFSSSDDSGEPITLSLKQTIPGFKKGVMGMKVGEKRRLFIHPDLGYGTSGHLLPNALLIFEVEVIDLKPELKQDEKAPKDKEDSKLSTRESLFPDDLEGDDDEDFDEDDNEAPEQVKSTKASDTSKKTAVAETTKVAKKS